MNVAYINIKCGSAFLVAQLQVFARGSHEHGCYLAGGEFKTIDNSIGHSLVNQSSRLVGIHSVMCTTIYLSHPISENNIKTYLKDGMYWIEFSYITRVQ